MAKLTMVKDQTDPDFKPTHVTTEIVEVRAWGLAGKESQQFYIGSGLNFSAAGNIWLEILYEIGGVNLFYTRDFLHHTQFCDQQSLLKSLDRFVAGESDSFGFGDMLPNTYIRFKRDKFTHDDRTYISYSLEISSDVGAVFCESAPGENAINIHIKYLSVDTGAQFMRELIDEIGEACRGKHPNPAALPPGSSEWPFARLMNERAYDIISQTYQEDYFAHPALKSAFDGWMRRLPKGGRVLDVGCGHGDPVITHLLEKGYQVTGVDTSNKMLERARSRFSTTPFHQLSATNLPYEAEFDGACSLSSMLYLDPIDFFTGIYRLYQAIKPNGLLFLHACDTHPTWRASPFGVRIGQWMWAWTYSLEEAKNALEEHGYFKVLRAQIVEVYEPQGDASSKQDQEAEPTSQPQAQIQSPELIKKYPNDYIIVARRLP